MGGRLTPPCAPYGFSVTCRSNGVFSLFGWAPVGHQIVLPALIGPRPLDQRNDVLNRKL